MYYTLRQIFKKVGFIPYKKKYNEGADLSLPGLCNSGSPNQLGLNFGREIWLKSQVSKILVPDTGAFISLLL